MSRGKEIRFLVIFGAVYLLFHTTYFLVPDAFLRDLVYHYGIVAISSDLINLCTPMEATSAIANKLISSKASLEIVRGCDGAGATFLLMAAILAFSAPWKQKLLGVAASLLLLYVINQLRVISLYFVVVYQRGWFQMLHTYFAPTLIIIVCCIFFVWWTRWSSNLREIKDQSRPA